MEEESRQKTDRKRMLGLLTVSCAATLCFAGLYVQELKTVEKLERAVKQNTRDIDTIYKRMKTHYQKIGIVRYDAFQEMGGNLSFVLTMLDENNNGWVFNAMHSREGCYTYIKEIVKGESYMELGEEERESLKKAMKQ